MREFKIEFSGVFTQRFDDDEPWVEEDTEMYRKRMARALIRELFNGRLPQSFEVAIDNVTEVTR